MHVHTPGWTRAFTAGKDFAPKWCLWHDLGFHCLWIITVFILWNTTGLSLSNRTECCYKMAAVTKCKKCFAYGGMNTESQVPEEWFDIEKHACVKYLIRNIPEQIITEPFSQNKEGKKERKKRSECVSVGVCVYLLKYCFKRSALHA